MSTTPDVRPLSVPFSAHDALFGIDRINTEEQVNDAIRAISAPVVAAELRRLAAEISDLRFSDTPAATAAYFLLTRADQIDGGDPE